MPRASGFAPGQNVVFISRAGRRFDARIDDGIIRHRKVSIWVATDPFPVLVNVAQVHPTEGEGSVPTTTRVPESRQLAKDARLLGIKGYQKMTIAQLRKAVAAAQNGKTAPVRKAPAKKAVAKAAKAPTRKARPASKPATSPRKTVAEKAPAKRTTAAKKAPAKRAVTKASAKKVAAKRTAKTAPARTTRAAASANGVNPFRVGSNMHKMAEELIKGGKQGDMVKRLKKSMPIHPWTKDKEENPERAIAKRLGIAIATLVNDHGFTFTKEGRGASAVMQVFPPKSTGQRGRATASSKKKR